MTPEQHAELDALVESRAGRAVRVPPKFKPNTPYEQGVFAREHGFGMVQDNPFPSGTPAWKEFCRGWMAMNRQLAGLNVPP